MHTISQAQRNVRNVRIKQTGYGHWQVSASWRNKLITITTTDSMAIDDFNSDPFDKDGRLNRRKRGYETLLGYISRAV